MQTRRRQLQDEAAKLTNDIETLRAAVPADDKEASVIGDRLEEAQKRADVLCEQIEREDRLDAKLGGLRKVITDGCEPRGAIEKPESPELAMFGVAGRSEDRAGMEKVGVFLRNLRDGHENRAWGELSGTYDGKGTEYVPIELYNQVINRIKYSSVAMQQALVVNAVTNRITLPKVGDATASFVADGTATTDQDVTTSGVTVNVLEMRASIAVGNSLIDDSPIDVAALVTERLGLAYAKKIDDAWLGGDSTTSPAIGGLYAGITSGNKVTIATGQRASAANLASLIGLVDPFVTQTAFIVSAAGWADLFNIASGQIGTMVFGGTTPTPTVWGIPVFKVKGLPTNVKAIYGDFQFTSAVAIKPNGLQITAARELLIRNNQTLFASVQRVGISNHAPEFAAALVQTP